MERFTINLDRARRQAKALLAAARRGDPTALGRLRPDRSPRLSDAQHAIARGHGFRTWAELVQTTEDPGSILRRAARAGDEDLMYSLLEAGAPPNSRDRRTGRTPLHMAVAADQLDAVAVLVGWVPVDLCATDSRGRSALDLARPGSPVAAVLSACGLGPARAPLPTTHAELAYRADVALLDHLSQVDGVTREPVGDGFWFRTGLADNSRNGVVCRQLPAGVAVESVLERLSGVPAIWYTGPGPAEAGAGLGSELERAGCDAERASVHMAAGLADLEGRRSPHVDETQELSDLVHLERGEAELLAAAGPPLRHFVIPGRAGLTVFVTGSTVLGVHLRVSRGHRRQGLARTLVGHAVVACADDGAVHAVLAPTPATIPLYEKLGFVLEQSLSDAWYYLPHGRPER